MPSHSPILLVQLVLPFQRAILQDAVIPNHQPAGHGTVHLCSQMPQEGGQIFHRHRLAGESRGQLDTGQLREPCTGTHRPREQCARPGAGGAEPLQEAGSGGRQGAGAAHTQRVLNVDQPPIKAVVLGDAGQLVAHGAVRFCPTSQECLAQLLPTRPLRDEGTWGAGEGSVAACPGELTTRPGSARPRHHIILQLPALPSPSTGTPFL